MILLCSDIRKLKVKDQEGISTIQYIHSFSLGMQSPDTSLSENKGLTAVVLNIMSEKELKDIEPGEYYKFKRFPFSRTMTSEEVNNGNKINNRVKEKV